MLVTVRKGGVVWCVGVGVKRAVGVGVGAKTLF
jgi:hypothetical protein